MLVAVAFMLTALVAGLAARGALALRAPLGGRAHGTRLSPSDVSEIASALDETAIRYRGFNRAASTRELSRILERRARRGHHVVTAATETCDTLGRSTFMALQDGTVIRLDAAEASVEGEPWALTGHPEDVVLGARLHSARMDEHGLTVRLLDHSRAIRISARGGAYVGDHN